MAFRIHDSILRGEIDNRIKGRVRGRIWIVGRDQPVDLELRGNPRRDLAGCHLAFENPNPPVPHPHLVVLHVARIGAVGDLTALRKVRVLDVPLDQALNRLACGEAPPEHVANSLYLEWVSARNGRVGIEARDCNLTLSTPKWRMSRDEER